MTSRFDVKAFLLDHNIRFVSRGKNVGKEDVNIKCPNCDDPSFHLGIYKETGIFHCWRCDFSGNFITLIQKLLGVPYYKAKKIAVSYSYSTGIEETENNQKNNEVVFPDNSFLILDALEDDEIESYRLKAILYLKSRFVNPYNKMLWMFTPKTNDNYSCLIIIPVFFNGEIVTWIGRRYIDKDPRYVNCPKDKCILTVKEVLYNYDSYTEDDFVFITEGIFDALRFGRFGLASFGKILGEKQLELLYIKRPRKIFYVPDRDVSQEEVKVNFNQLKLITETVMLWPPTKYKDVGEMKKSEVLQWLREELSEEDFEKIFNEFLSNA